MADRYKYCGPILLEQVISIPVLPSLSVIYHGIVFHVACNNRVYFTHVPLSYMKFILTYRVDLIVNISFVIRLPNKTSLSQKSLNKQ